MTNYFILITLLVGYPVPVQLPATIKGSLNLKLSDSVMSGSHYLFDKFGFGKSWLAKPIQEWKECEDFKEMSEFFRNLLVTNDSAERGVKLVSEYAQILTKDPEERQDILQCVEQDRTEVPDVTKKTLSKFLNRD